MNYGPLARVLPPLNPPVAPPTHPDATPPTRPDARTKPEQLRPIFLRGSILSGASGSSYIEAGNTKIFCAVHGPRPSSSSRSLAPTIHCELRYAEFSQTTSPHMPRRDGGMTDRERDLSIALSQTLSSTILCHQYPKARIDVSAFVLEDDGAAFAAVITAASLALADAGIHMRDLTAGAAVAVASGTCVLDPCKKEENEAQGGVLVAFMPVSNGVAGFMQTGEVGMTYIDTAVSVCCAAAAQIVALMRTCLYKQEKKALKKRARV